MFTKNEENNPLLMELVFVIFIIISKVVKLAVLELENADLNRKRKVKLFHRLFFTKLQKKNRSTLNMA